MNFSIRNYVVNNLKSQEYITSRATTIGEIYEDSNPSKPIIIILS